MKIFLIILSFLIITALILLFALAHQAQDKQAQGLNNGRLSPCSTTPNCICSENIDDVDHYIAPLSYTEYSNTELRYLLVEIIQSMGGVLSKVDEIYLSATFTSSIFHFVDDLEIRIDETKHLIHIRSASRVGHSDLGMNKKRVELLKQLYKEKIGEHD